MLFLKRSMIPICYWNICLAIGLIFQSASAGSVLPNSPEYLNQPALATIHALAAYNQGYSGKGVKIGVVDGGINPNHLELQNVLIAAMGWQRTNNDLYNPQWQSTTGTSNFADFLNEYEADGHTLGFGHGGFVTSVIAGRLDNADRPGNIMGVAYHSQIVFGQLVFPQRNQYGRFVAAGLSDAQWAQAIDFVSGQGVKVINNSWGMPSDENSSLMQEIRDEIAHAPQTIAALKRAQARGAVIVFAAGNDNAKWPNAPRIKWPGAPSTLPSIDPEVLAKGGWITVAATTIRGINPAFPDRLEMAGYSNLCGDAKAYCISAPGGYSDALMNGIKAGTNDQYREGAGTSYAAPLVTGAVALVAEKYPWMDNKNLSTTILTTGSHASDPSPIWGRGLLDVAKAIEGPGIFEEDFQANVDTLAPSYTFGNNISGKAGIRKNGSGTLILSGNNTYMGDTYFDAGTLAVSNMSNLGSSVAPLQFNGGALKFLNDFDLTRPVFLNSNGGFLNLNQFDKSQTFNISGNGSLGLIGGGSLNLNRPNTQTGGFLISDNSHLYATNDNQLGAANSPIALDGGALHLGDNFNSTLTRPIYVGPDNGKFYMPAQTIIYTGGLIQSFNTGNTLGLISFDGTPFTIGADLTLNALWDGDLVLPANIHLHGYGGPTGQLLINGTFSPGNSPGISQFPGSVAFNNASVLNIEIDGTGMGIGAGNYDRIILTNANSIFTAGGTLQGTLRGISNPANNNYSPSVGQGFQIVTAPGGVLGSFANLVQPGVGLLPGTQLDTVYNEQTLFLYATPASYADLSLLGLKMNATQSQVGAALQSVRPTAGIRAADIGIKKLFDNLAPQTSDQLLNVYNNMSGLSHAEFIRMHYETSRFLVDEITTAISDLRVGNSDPVKVGKEIWGHAIRRVARRQNSQTSPVSSTNKSMGFMGGTQQHFNHTGNFAGLAVAYANSDAMLSEGMGNASFNHLQLMGYAHHPLNERIYFQGQVGGGTGYIRSHRSLLTDTYSASVNTANLALAMQAGLTLGSPDNIYYDAKAGLQYLGMHYFRFNERGSALPLALKINGGTMNSIASSMNGSISIPLRTASGISNARLTASAGLDHYFGGSAARIDTNFLNTSLSLTSNPIGKNRITCGLRLSGYLASNTMLVIDLTHQTSAAWKSTALTSKLNVEF